MTTPLTCRNCGWVGTEAEPVESAVWRGLMLGPFCKNVVTCWARVAEGHKGVAWDKQGLWDAVKE